MWWFAYLKVHWGYWIEVDRYWIVISECNTETSHRVGKEIETLNLFLKVYFKVSWMVT